jgi:hypothetical protein
MPIQVVRNTDANAITFRGTTHPTYFNACLSAFVDPIYPTLINIRNDIATNVGGDVVYEFYQMPFTEFRDANNNPFASAQDCADYITSIGNIVDNRLVLDGDDILDFSRDSTNSTVTVNNGDQWGVNTLRAVSQDNGTIRIFKTVGGVDVYKGLQVSNTYVNGVQAYSNIQDAINQLNAIFSVTSDAFVAGTYTISTESSGLIIIRESDELAASGTSVFTSGTVNDIYSTTLRTDAVINDAGEYFEFDQCLPNEHFIAGLMATSGVAAAPSGFTHEFEGFHLAASTNDQDHFSHRAPEDAIVGPAMNVSGYCTWRLGLDENRFPYFSAVTSSGTIIVTRSASALADGENLYAGWKIISSDTSLSGIANTTVNLVASGQQPVLYYYIQSPDNNWTYPLFRNQYEANDYDAANDEGFAAGSTSQVYVDDPSNTTWYLPNNGNTVNSASGAPSNTANIIWNEIQTAADSDFAPEAYDLYDTVTVNEGSAVNLVASALGVSYTTTIQDMQPSGWLTINSTALQGTAPQVSGNNVNNPSDTYSVTIKRTNSYGSSFGSFDIVVNNTTAPGVEVSGLTWVSGTVAPIDEDTLDDGSVASFDTALPSGKRYIFRQPWVETYVLPQLQEEGDSVYLGVLDQAYTPSSGGIGDSDFDVAIRWDYVSAFAHRSNLIGTAATSGNIVQINSATDAYYDYGFEADDHGDLYIVACNNLDLNTQPGLDYGGQFGRSLESSGVAPHEIVIATSGTTVDLAVTDDISLIDIPLAPRWIQVTKPADSNLLFNGSGTFTLNANYTYRFLMAEETWINDLDTGLVPADILRFTQTGSNVEYTSGISRVGAVGTPWAYVEFDVPSDVPPLQWYNDASGISTGTGVSIAGSTYVESVSGITLEGPAANQTGTNVMDQYEHGWISLNEQLSAGERLVMDNAFWTDFLAELNESTNMFAIGLKGDNWTNTKEVNAVEAASTGEFFKGDTYIVGSVAGGNYIYFRIYSNGVASNQMLVNTTALHSTVCAFLEITSSGDNIRAAFGRNGDLSVTQGDESTVAYADWSSYKGQTGDQGYGITSKDVMISFWTYSGGDIDGANIDWSALTEVVVPTQASSITTNWTKALDFSGGSEYTFQANSNYLYTPLNLGNLGATVAAGTAGSTSNDSNARPWATAIVFSSDNNNSNQHIWNCGEGAGSTDDNIYLRVTGTRDLYFGWGRSSSLNECYLGNLASGSGNWYGIYIAHTGERLSATDAIASNLADCFDIRLVNLSTGAVGSNMSTSSNWYNTGGRMDRQFQGTFTIGGRGSNRNFHGKVAAMVSTTLRRNVAMPTDAEISMMVRDPQQWLTDYKVGNSYRRPSVGTDSTNFQLGSLDPASSTQVWLMGDGTSDAFSTIRNQVYAGHTGRTTLIMNSMVSSDIENVSITGLS